MRYFNTTTIAVLAAAAFVCVQGQETPGKDAQIESKGTPPRATPADYQAQAQAGTVTIGAEFKGHAVPTFEGPLNTEDFVAVEIGLFGPPEERLKISADNFSLRLNGKKTALPSQPYGLIVSSLKDPEWEPPEPPASKSKTSLGGGGQGESSGPPPPVKIPVAVQRAMAQRVQKASLPEGDRTLPQAGLVFFQHRGKTGNLQSIELIYAGPAGKAILKLQP